MYDINQVKSVYDELTTKVKADLDEQFNLGRLKGSDYAEVYAKLMDECLQLAFEAPLKEQQTINLLKDLDVKNSQIDVNNEEIKLRQQQITSMQLDDNRKDNLTNSEISLNNEDIKLKQQQVTSMQKDDYRKDNITNKELALKDAEINTQKRQEKGFDDNMKLKLFEAQINAWSMMFSSGMLNTEPSIISNDEVTTLYNNIKSELGL